MICVKEVGRKDNILVHLCWSRCWASTLSVVELFWADISVTNTRIWLAVYLFHGSHEYFKNEPVIFKITQGEKEIYAKTVLIKIFVPPFFTGERLCSLLSTPPCIPSVLSTSLGCHSFDDHLASKQEGGKSKNVVNLGAIRQGMKRFQFLLNCCEPGTIPDASILAAALDLVSHFWSLVTCWEHVHLWWSTVIHQRSSCPTDSAEPHSNAWWWH